MFKEIYIELCEVITEKMPQIKWIDLWTNQTDYLEQEIPFPTPAIFIEFNANSFSNVGRFCQDIDLAITFHIVVENNAETFYGSYNQQSALTVLDYINDLQKNLHACSGQNYSKLSRSALQQLSFDNIQHFSITYNSIVRDYSAEPNYINQILPNNDFKIITNQ